jgi:hypothetical protein
MYRWEGLLAGVGGEEWKAYLGYDVETVADSAHYCGHNKPVSPVALGYSAGRCVRLELGDIGTGSHTQVVEAASPRTDHIHTLPRGPEVAVDTPVAVRYSLKEQGEELMTAPRQLWQVRDRFLLGSGFSIAGMLFVCRSGRRIQRDLKGRSRRTRRGLPEPWLDCGPPKRLSHWQEGVNSAVGRWENIREGESARQGWVLRED